MRRLGSSSLNPGRARSLNASGAFFSFRFGLARETRCSQPLFRQECSDPDSFGMREGKRESEGRQSLAKGKMDGGQAYDTRVGIEEVAVDSNPVMRISRGTIHLPRGSPSSGTRMTHASTLVNEYSMKLAHLARALSAHIFSPTQHTPSRFLFRDARERAFASLSEPVTPFFPGKKLIYFVCHRGYRLNSLKSFSRACTNQEEEKG